MMKGVVTEVMTIRKSYEVVFANAIGFGLAYVILVVLLMVANTTKLGFGDKFGPDGWRFYWPISAVMFAPPVLVIVCHRLADRGRPKSEWGFYLTSLVIILAAMEGSFLLDLHWAAVLPEVIVLSIGAHLLCKRASRHDS
jgi:uncharacterized membrane protein YhaH (DUF805 family)